MNRIAVVCLLTALSQVLGAEEIYVNHPFSSKIAKNNFFKCFPELRNDSEMLKVMDSISRIAYKKFKVEGEGCPNELSSCLPNRTYFRGVRSTKIEAPYLSTTSARRISNSLVKNGCSFSRVSGFRHNVTRKTARVTFNWRHQKRACDKLLGKHNICESKAKLAHTTTFNPNFTVTESTQVYDKDVSCFGVPDSFVEVAFAGLGALTGGGYGTLAGILIGDELTRQSHFDTPTFLGKGVQLDAAVEISAEVGKGDDYVMTYFRSFEKSGFVKHGDAGDLEYVETGVLDTLFEDSYWKEREMEIKFLKDISKIERPIYEVKRGDTLWAIAQDEFGVGELYLLLEGINEASGADLRVGQKIELPLHHEVCEMVNHAGSVVRHGDSIWKKIERGELPNDSLKLLQPRSGDVNLIYPFEVLSTQKVEGID